MIRKSMLAGIAAGVLVLLVPAMVFAIDGTYVYGEVKYSGSHTGKVGVCALLEGEESPTKCVNHLMGPGPFSIGPLPPGEYHVCAFFDFDEDGGPPEADEPVGCTMVDLTEGSVRGVVVVMQDPEVEFVPEPGAIMLLGSGLAGLAGYATLRRKSRR